MEIEARGATQNGPAAEETPTQKIITGTGLPVVYIDDVANSVFVVGVGPTADICKLYMP